MPKSLSAEFIAKPAPFMRIAIIDAIRDLIGRERPVPGPDGFMGLLNCVAIIDEIAKQLQLTDPHAFDSDEALKSRQSLMMTWPIIGVSSGPNSMGNFMSAIWGLIHEGLMYPVHGGEGSSGRKVWLESVGLTDRGRQVVANPSLHPDRAKIKDAGAREAESPALRRARVFDERQFHHALTMPKVRKLFADGHFDEAAKAAAVEFFAAVKSITKLTSDGSDLVSRAFSTKDPLIKITEQRDDTEKSIQQGVLVGAQMVALLVRNPPAHTNDDRLGFEETLEAIGTISMLLRHVDRRIQDESLPLGQVS